MRGAALVALTTLALPVAAAATPPPLPCTSLWPSAEILKAVADHNYTNLAKLSNEDVQLDTGGSHVVLGQKSVIAFLSSNLSGAVSPISIKVFNEAMLITFNLEKSLLMGERTHEYMAQEGLLFRCDYATNRISKIEVLGRLNDWQQSQMQPKWSVH